ncbi:diguanylate cyclase [Actinoplanes sp. SE50]|uniref:putative bifunctional diguanylate cyclase/phosphodiesterase n=1 Tax=unclassified Actinoplanes TaxID=2626549 RepID=UPI00023EC950|nr:MULTISPECIES: EAL domain-containing protein [unclassified Actinoplanes]AEV83718.1 Signaling protein ykoW [Actinoplanes sp. SE50/110]ATO82138.1 diguanylate cyclase [Actinoplanes sp. SE50]SLL99545.1 GGDEF domain-containing protein [Actinoplanes sp. SE50/110]
MTTRTARACFAAWSLLLVALYYAFPAAHLYTWALLGYSSAAAILVGTRLNRPGRRLPWYLVSAALACFTTGDSWYNLVLALGGRPGFPGLADLFYLLVYPLLTGALLLFIRARSGRGDNRGALLDALVPTVGLGLLAWVYWIAPFTRAQDLTVLQKIVSIGYPLGDVLVLAMILRMLTQTGTRPRTLGSLGVAMLGLLVSDIFYGQSQLRDDWVLGGPVDLGWVLFYSAMGFTALRPSMRQLTEPAERCRSIIGRHRLVWMTAAALIAPILLCLEYLQGRPAEIQRDGIVDAPVIAGAAAVMFLLVLGRLADLAMAQRQAVARERALREAGALLFAAATERDVVAALHQAVARLMPPGQPYHLELPPQAPGPADVAVHWRAAADLPAGVDAGGFPTVLFATQPLPGRQWHGQLIVGAAEDVLQTLRPALQTLGAQIAVVLDRISLTAEVGRRESETYFRTLVQRTVDVILIVDGDQDTTVRYASPSADKLFGTVIPAGTPLADLIAPEAQEALRDVLCRLRRGHGDLDGVELTAQGAGGRRMTVECDLRDLRDDPTVAGLVVTLRDVTEQRRLEDDLTHQAFHDSLTGLANRVLFRNRLEQAFTVASRDGATLGVLFVDLDDFKEVNDTLGHAIGDQLLIAVARRISSIIGAGSTAARMGGDEFAILVEQSDTAHAAEDVAARLVAALDAPIEVPDGEGGLHLVSGRVSVGVATSGDADNATELLRHADLALYLAKGMGKAGWQRYQSDLAHAMVQRLEMRAQLHEAIEDEQFMLQFQPIVELADQRVTGVEALVRWQHPTRGLLGPFHFVEAAEENGAIVGIGNWVMREALCQIARWKADDPHTTLRYVSVNVSPRQFRSADFVDQVRAALAAAGARPEWLLLEITESLVLRDADKVVQDLRALRAMGVRVAIDDFGTGYSSLSYLRQMPVDVLKLDKSFIDDILTSRQQHALVDAIVTLAGNLDLAVVAEGIEEPGQHLALDAMGCHYGQGYHFAKPLWPTAIPALTAAAEAIAMTA